MAPTVKHVLLDILEDLNKKQLKKFCARLLDRKEEPYVRRNAVEDQDEVAIVEVLVSVFTEDGAVRVVVDLLRAIECNDLAVKLEKQLLTTSEPSARTPHTGTMSPETHFVDKHHDALVQRISSVAAILDVLLTEKVVNDEQYAHILAKATPQDQIRALYMGPIKSSGAKGKDIFLKALQEKEHFLIQELRGK